MFTFLYLLNQHQGETMKSKRVARVVDKLYISNNNICSFINNNQLDALNLFYSKFISCLYMFRAPCAQRQEVKILLYSIWYHHTYRCDDTRDCIVQFCPPGDEHMVLETCRGLK